MNSTLTGKIKNNPLTRRLINYPLSRKFLVFVSTYLMIIFLLYVIAWVAMNMLSGIRSFVGAEGMWSKGQKDAVYQLTRYAVTRHDNNYQAYLKAAAIPLGFKRLHDVLEAKSLDYDAAREHWAATGSHPDDLLMPVIIYRWFGFIDYVAKAKNIWTEGDIYLAELVKTGKALREGVTYGDMSTDEMNRALYDIEAINAKLTPLEEEFSATLGEAARWMQSLLLWTMFLATALCVGIGLMISNIIVQYLSKAVMKLRSGAEKIARGEFIQIPVQSVDEMGQLATAFNEMSEGLLEAGERVAHRTKELYAVQKQQEDLMEGMPDIICVVDREGRMIKWNRRLEITTGRAAHELKDQPMIDLVLPSERERVMLAIEDGLRTSEFYEVETPIVTAPNIPTPHLLWKGVKLRDDQGKSIGLICSARDITIFKQAEEQRLTLASLVENSLDFIGVATLEGQATFINPAGRDLVGLENMHQAKLTHIFDYIADEDREEFQKTSLPKILKEGSWKGELRFKHFKSGSLIPMQVTSFLVKDRFNNKPIAIAAVSRDITERKQSEERLSHMAHHDSLTGLPNRELMADRLNQALARAERRGTKLAVVFLDLDHFKVINDTLGHDLGDRLLIAVAERLLDNVRSVDTVARLGGDEFVMILEDVVTVEDVTRIIDKVLDAVASPLNISGHELFVTPSIGISMYPKDATDASALLKTADTAMYRAKEGGRSRYQLYTQDMNEKSTTRLTVDSRLRRALEREEFELHYQPIINIASGQIVSVEALLRWNQPELGMIQPADFIPLAEETGLIVPIGEWVIATACKQNREWHKTGLSKISVAVNISPRQLHEEGGVARIEKILKESGLASQYLELELTESLLVKNVDTLSGYLSQLHELGMKISIDDFGTGYSSLSYLKRFPISTLKIDQSFVRDISDDADDAAIVSAIVTMAHTLKLKVVAEAVETQQQLDFLRNLNCDHIQGYLYSTPLAAQEMTELLTRSTRGKLISIAGGIRA